jgi:CheY-like chemotaxis protein
VEAAGAMDSKEQRADGGGPTMPKRILVVDDDALVRAGIAALLEDLGHVVIEANCSEEALDLLSAGNLFDVVITDHMMPGMSGSDLAARILGSFPDVLVVLASGYGDLPVCNIGTRELRRLDKPFRGRDLALLIADTSRRVQSTTTPYAG